MAQEPIKKKQKGSFCVLIIVLEHESLYLEQLPNADQYETSLMHRDVVNFCFVTKYKKA
jgi:hypothetical protein